MARNTFPTKQCLYGAPQRNLCLTPNSAASFQAIMANHFISLFPLHLILRENQHQESKGNDAVKQSLHQTNKFVHTGVASGWLCNGGTNTTLSQWRDMYAVFHETGNFLASVFNCQCSESSHSCPMVLHKNYLNVPHHIPGKSLAANSQNWAWGSVLSTALCRSLCGLSLNVPGNSDWSKSIHDHSHFTAVLIIH